MEGNWATDFKMKNACKLLTVASLLEMCPPGTLCGLFVFCYFTILGRSWVNSRELIHVIRKENEGSLYGSWHGSALKWKLRPDIMYHNMPSLVYKDEEKNKNMFICLHMLHIHEIPLKGDVRESEHWKHAGRGSVAGTELRLRGSSHCPPLKE